MVKIVNKQEVVSISTNFSKFEESQGKLIRISAKLEQMNWSNIFGIFSELKALRIIAQCLHKLENFQNFPLWLAQFYNEI